MSSELWICREQTARHPYHPDGTDLELWTIEELCFYLYQNMERLDDTVLDEPLFLWLSEELKLPRLSALLGQEKKREKNAFWCAWFLLKESGMYGEEELLEYKSFCLAMDNVDEFEGQKRRADRLFLNGRYQKSIQEYERLISLDETRKRYPQLQGDMWHNRGVALSQLFLFAEAAESFQKAYALNRREESRKGYEDARQLADWDQEEWTVPISGQPGESDREGFEAPSDWELSLEKLRKEYKKKVT